MDSAAPTDNARVALLLRQAAALLAAQGANRFRVAAYRQAADGIAALARDVGALFEAEGRAGLDALPGIGPGLANAIAEILSTGRWGLLDRLRGEVDARLVFRAVPGVGPAAGGRARGVGAVLPRRRPGAAPAHRRHRDPGSAGGPARGAGAGAGLRALVRPRRRRTGPLIWRKLRRRQATTVAWPPRPGHRPLKRLGHE